MPKRKTTQKTDSSNDTFWLIIVIVLIIVILSGCCAPAEAAVKCNPVIDYKDGKLINAWNKLCVGYRYNKNNQHDIGTDTFEAYRIILGGAGGFNRVNACCKGYRRSNIYKELHKAKNRSYRKIMGFTNATSSGSVH